jgi:hypothetical protein
MFSKYVPIHIKKIDQIVNWENVSDFHMGNSNHVTRLAKSVRKRLLDDDYRFTSFGGDQLDLILPKNDPRYNDRSVKIRSKGEQMDAFDDFWEPVFKEQLKFLEGKTKNEKIWYEQWGNHEYNSRVMEEAEFQRWCLEHGTTYLGSKGFIRLEIFYKGKSTMKKTLHVNHGFGSGDAKKALENLTVNVEADVYQMGHLHQPMGIKTDTLYFNDDTKHWDSKDQILVNSGCFTTGIADDKDEWFGQRNKLKTSKPGTVTISFDSYQGKMNVHG